MTIASFLTEIVSISALDRFFPCGDRSPLLAIALAS